MEGTSFMLDDDMVRLLDKFQDDTYNLRYNQVYNYHYFLTILEAIFFVYKLALIDFHIKIWKL